MSNDNLNINTSTSQRKAIEAYLRGGNSLTALQALNHFGAGLPVERTLVAVINRDGKKVRVAEYRLHQGAAA